MRAFDLISLLDPDLDPAKMKIHLANWNGRENPLDEYLCGRFEEWQRWQTRRNFERPYVMSLIALRSPNQWLFAGVHDSAGATRHEEYKLQRYELSERPAASELNGRLIVAFSRPGRQSYLNCESWVDRMQLHAVLPERMKIAEFPGFRAVSLAKHELDAIVMQGIESWKAALSSVAGVYLISDTVTGMLYVGTATGAGGIWQRWTQYVATGHGGNKELCELLKEVGMERASEFRFSILEIADTHDSPDDVLRRESHWKEVLLSRLHGLNAN